MKNFVVITLMLFSLHSFSQEGIIITKTNDTLLCSEVKLDYPTVKYKLYSSENINKIKFNDIVLTFSKNNFSLKTNEVDDFTGKLLKLTDNISFGASAFNPDDMARLTFNVLYVNDSNKVSYILSAWSDHYIGCSGSKDNYMYIKLMDNTVIKLEKDISKINCKQGTMSNYVLSQENVLLLSTTKVSSIRFKQSENYIDFFTLDSDCIIKCFNLFK